MKAREGQKRAIFPSLIWEGGGGLGFPFILSKIVALVILSLLLEIMLWASNLSYLQVVLISKIYLRLSSYEKTDIEYSVL